MKKTIMGISLCLLSCISFAQQEQRKPSAEQRLNRIKQQYSTLQLSAAQQGQFDAAFTEFFAHTDSLRMAVAPPPPGIAPPPPPPPTPPAMTAERKQLLNEFREQRNAKVKRILTPEQYSTFIEMENAMHKKRENTIAPPPPPPPPPVINN
ncbi:hypothetical protein BH09BAC2_BH09BAC2_04790 [soil metagenome]